MVKGIEAVDGKDAYVVAITSAKGREFTNYYDVETGLKIKLIQMADGPDGKKYPVATFLSDYKAIFLK